MKRHFFKPFIIIAVLVISFSLLAACTFGNLNNRLSYDSSVVKAFNAVKTDDEDIINQTAVAEGQKYLVTLITSSAVSQYSLDAEFNVENKVDIIGGVALAATVEDETLSAPERAFAEALKLSQIAKSDVEGFDFDRDTYMGRSVYKVEIEDAVAEYSYIFSADDFTLIDSKTQIKNSQSSGGSSYIGEDKAKAIALDVVGTTFDKVSNFTIKSVVSEGKKLYKVKLDYEGYRYSLDIDALKGDIVKFAKSVLDANASNPDVPEIITEEEAKTIATNFAFPDGVGDKNIIFGKVKLDYERGKFVYEVEFTDGNNEYEFEISASDGVIIDMEIDALSSVSGSAGNGSTGGSSSGNDSQSEFITRQQAIDKALEAAGEGAFLIEVDVDKELVDGEFRYYYEIEVRVQNREIEYYVDAITGDVTVKREYEDTVTPAITEEQALRIALDTFKLNENEYYSKKIKLEREDGKLCYEISLYQNELSCYMTLDANSGEILSTVSTMDDDHDDHKDDEVQPPEDKFITSEQAIAAVKEKVGANARIKDVEFEDEGSGADRRYYYEVEVLLDGREYEYYVDAITAQVYLKGEILDSGKNYIGEKEAFNIALRKFSLSEKEVRIIKIKLDEDDGIMIYEVKFMVMDMEYSFEINAVTGEIIEYDISFD